MSVLVVDRSNNGFRVRVEAVTVSVLMMLSPAPPVIKPFRDWLNPFRLSAVPAAALMKPEMVRFVGKALETPRRAPAYPVEAPAKMEEFPPKELPVLDSVTKSPTVLPARNRMLAVVMPEAWVIEPVRASEAPSWVPMRQRPLAPSSIFPA